MQILNLLKDFGTLFVVLGFSVFNFTSINNIESKLEKTDAMQITLIEMNTAMKIDNEQDLRLMERVDNLEEKKPSLEEWLLLVNRVEDLEEKTKN